MAPGPNNPNGDIDLAGPDRVSETIRSIFQRVEGDESVWVHRTESYAYQKTDGSSTPQLLSITDTSLDGLTSWSTAAGLTTKSVTAYSLTEGGDPLRTVTVTRPDESYSQSIYDKGRLKAVATYDSQDTTPISGVEYEYDGHGRQETTDDARNGVTTYSYNNADQVISVAAPELETGGQSQTTEYSYDCMGRSHVITYADDNAVTNEYHLNGKLKKVYGARSYPVEYEYDAQGRMASMATWQDHAGLVGKAVTQWHYDPQRGFLDKKTYPDDKHVDYTYTLAGRLNTRTWARGSLTTYGYNSAGDLADITYGSDPNPTVEYTYDRMGRPKTVDDDAGERTLSYTPAGRLSSESYSGGLFDKMLIKHGYDSYNRSSGVTLEDDGSTVHSQEYLYDNASRLQTVSSDDLVVTYTRHQNSGLINTRTVAQTVGENDIERLAVSRAYDNLNRLKLIGSTPSSGSAVTYGYGYNNANQRTRVDLADGSYWLYEYDSKGQLLSGEKRMSTDEIIPGRQFDYDYDDIGNRKSEVRNAKPDTRESAYSANLANQYSQRTVPGYLDVSGSAEADATVTVSGQATERRGKYFYGELPVDNSGSAQQQSISVLRSLDGSDITKDGELYVPKDPEVFTYDNDGNLLTDGRWSYVWNGENRLSSMKTLDGMPGPGYWMEFTYDSRGRRVSKEIRSGTWDSGAGLWLWALTPATKTYLYDGWNVIREHVVDNDGAGTIWDNYYVWGLDLSGSLQGAGGIGGLLALTTDGDAYLPCYDGNGNVMQLVDASDGTVAAAYEYDPYGNIISKTGAAADDNPFRFSTKYWDEETGLYYYGRRYYSADSGRWIKRDSIAENGGVNLYGFVGNEPVATYDHLGNGFTFVGAVFGCLSGVMGDLGTSWVGDFIDERQACSDIQGERYSDGFETPCNAAMIQRTISPPDEANNTLGTLTKTCLINALTGSIRRGDNPQVDDFVDLIKSLKDLSDEVVKQRLKITASYYLTIKCRGDDSIWWTSWRKTSIKVTDDDGVEHSMTSKELTDNGSCSAECCKECE